VISLYIINSHGCNSDTVSQPFRVYPYPGVNAGPDKVVLEGGSVQIQSSASGNDLLYLWTPATYLNDDRILSPIASNLADDMTYTLTVTARGGCAKDDKVFIKLLKAPRIPNTFTPNNDGINDFWVIEYLETYPNNHVQVFTRTGQLVFESHGYSRPWDGNKNGKSLPFDTYYYIVEPNNGRKAMTGFVTIVK
jgi:gliding motility-associated-like protein